MGVGFFFFFPSDWGRKINFANSKTLVGVATDRDARHACLRFFSLNFSCFFLAFLIIFPVFFASRDVDGNRVLWQLVGSHHG